MIKKIIERLKFSDFARKEDGNIFITTAFLAPLLVLAVGVGVDTAEVYRAKVNFQNAVDAGALMVAKIVATEGGGTAAQAKAKRAGKNIFHANMRNLDPSKAEIDFEIDPRGCAAGGISAVATLDHKVFFDLFHNVSEQSGRKDHVKLHGKTDVNCGNTSLEIALVLDNSGSMHSQTKLVALKTAATNLVTTLHHTLKQSPLSEPVKFSLVPFNGAVSVGSQNKDQPWIDRYGDHPNHHENFNWAIDPGAKTDGTRWKSRLTGKTLHRLHMFDELRQPWGGCIEARPWPLNTTIDTASVSRPETLFVPMFAPDEPDNYNRQMSQVRSTDQPKVTCTTFRELYRGQPIPEHRRWCARWSDGSSRWYHPQDPYYFPLYNDNMEYRNGQYIGRHGRSGSGLPSGKWVDDKSISEITFANSYLSDDHNFSNSHSFNELGPGRHDHPRATPNTGFSRTQNTGGQMKRQAWTWKYFPAGTSKTRPAVSNTYYAGLFRGPNFYCRVQPITPLTSNEGSVVDDIDSMFSGGATNIGQGAVWGWRTLSSSEPFTQGRDDSVKLNEKVMILMSDGDNSYQAAWGNGSLYGAYGYSNNGRIFTGTSSGQNIANNGTNFRKAMDFHLATTCENAKRAGISIYSIAFSIGGGSTAKELLSQCASVNRSGLRQYYDAKNSASLIAAFEDIALSLSELKITK